MLLSYGTLNNFMGITAAHFEIHLFVLSNSVLERWQGKRATS